MNLIAWLIVGGLAGWIGGKIMNTGGQGLVTNIITGIVGAMIGGFVMNQFFGAQGATGLDFYSVLVAIIGSVILIWLLKAFRGNK